MNFLALFLQLLPSLIQGAETVGAHLAGHEKKAAVQAGLVAIAQGVGALAPQHATAAATAAATAVAGIDGVVKVLTEAGVINQQKAATATAGV
jgi:hypothetical protein